MKSLLLAASVSLFLAATIAPALADPPLHFSVDPQTYDPANTDLPFSEWENGAGCPTNAGVSTTGGKKPDTTYTDPACPTGDPKDKENEGLFLGKTGPTGNYAAGLANINGLQKGTALTELGYDIRKPGPTSPPSLIFTGDTNDPRGSHCGAGAPRFDITLADGSSYFLGCNSPAPDSDTAGTGWQRLRWGTSGHLMAFPSGSNTAVDIYGRPLADHGLQIVFDEGQDTGPDNFGAAVLDNIDVDGVLVGQH